MNAPTIIPMSPGDQRPKITAADLFHIMEQGVIDPEAKFDLVEGEMVPTSPQGPLHQDRGPGDGIWREVILVKPNEVSTIAAAPGFALRLADAG